MTHNPVQVREIFHLVFLRALALGRGLRGGKMVDLKKFPLRMEPGRVRLLEWDKIFYIEAERDDSLVRTARKELYRHIEPLHDLEPRLPSPPFFRIHRSYLVNLDRVFELRQRGEGEYEIKMDPPVNKVLPVSRNRYPELRDILGL